MRRCASNPAILFILTCIAAPLAWAQNEGKIALEATEKPKFVYRTSGKLTEQSAEYEKEGWKLCSSYVDPSGKLMGIFRRRYNLFDPNKEPLKGLKGSWKLYSIFEYNVDKSFNPSVSTLKFTNSSFAFTQTEGSAAMKNRIRYVQEGTVQDAWPVKVNKHFVQYAVDMLIEADKVIEPDKVTDNGSITSETKPYALVRTLIQIDTQGTLIIVSNGLTNARPTTTSSKDNLAFSRYR